MKIRVYATIGKSAVIELPAMMDEKLDFVKFSSGIPENASEATLVNTSMNVLAKSLKNYNGLK